MVAPATRWVVFQFQHRPLLCLCRRRHKPQLIGVRRISSKVVQRRGAAHNARPRGRWRRAHSRIKKNHLSSAILSVHCKRRALRLDGELGFAAPLVLCLHYATLLVIPRVFASVTRCLLHETSACSSPGLELPLVLAQDLLKWDAPTVRLFLRDFNEVLNGPADVSRCAAETPVLIVRGTVLLYITITPVCCARSRLYLQEASFVHVLRWLRVPMNKFPSRTCGVARSHTH